MDDILRFPTAVKHDPAIDAWLAAQRRDLRPFVESWFARMRRRGRDVRELMHDGCPTACVGDAAFGYVNAFTDHVNVGFFFGALLDDPAGLLEGTGKRGRHASLSVLSGCAVSAQRLRGSVRGGFAVSAQRLRGSVRGGLKLRPGRDVDSAALAALVDAAYVDIKARIDRSARAGE